MQAYRNAVGAAIFSNFFKIILPASVVLALDRILVFDEEVIL